MVDSGCSIRSISRFVRTILFDDLSAKFVGNSRTAIRTNSTNWRRCAQRQNESTQNPVLRTLGPGSGVAKAETELKRQ